jgi:hypothetical protein
MGCIRTPSVDRCGKVSFLFINTSTLGTELQNEILKEF